MLEHSGKEVSGESFKDDFYIGNTSSLNASARKAQNLFVSQQKRDMDRGLGQLRRQATELKLLTAAQVESNADAAGINGRPREQRVSDSGNSSAGSIMSAGSSEQNKSGGEPNGGSAAAMTTVPYDDGESGSGSTIPEDTGSGSTFTVVAHNNGHMGYGVPANKTSTASFPDSLPDHYVEDNDMASVSDLNRLEMMHGNVRRMSSTVSHWIKLVVPSVCTLSIVM